MSAPTSPAPSLLFHVYFSHLGYMLRPSLLILQLCLLCSLHAVFGSYIIKEQRLFPLAAQGEKC